MNASMLFFFFFNNHAEVCLEYICVLDSVKESPSKYHKNPTLKLGVLWQYESLSLSWGINCTAFLRSAMPLDGRTCFSGLKPLINTQKYTLAQTPGASKYIFVFRQEHQ